MHQRHFLDVTLGVGDERGNAGGQLGSERGHSSFLVFILGRNNRPAPGKELWGSDWPSVSRILPWKAKAAKAVHATPCALLGNIGFLESTSYILYMV